MIEQITWITDGTLPGQGTNLQINVVEVLLAVSVENKTVTGEGYLDDLGFRWARGEDVVGTVLGWAPMPKGPDAGKLNPNRPACLR